MLSIDYDMKFMCVYVFCFLLLKHFFLSLCVYIKFEAGKYDLCHVFFFLLFILFIFTSELPFV